jgi:hypothetical protein
MNSLEASDQAAAAVAVAPRVTLDDIKNSIVAEYGFIAGKAVAALEIPAYGHNGALDLLTIYILVVKNGFTVIGKSAPASPENFNAELGMKLAKEDAMRQLWPLMGYALRDRLAKPPLASAADTSTISITVSDNAES